MRNSNPIRLVYNMCAVWRGLEHSSQGISAGHCTRPGGCWVRSFISSQSPKAQAGRLLSLTYVLYKLRQCPTNAGFYSGKSLSITGELSAFLSPRERKWSRNPPQPTHSCKCRPASRGHNSEEVKTGERRKI